MNDSINYLLSIEAKGIKLGLSRTEKIMNACGNPHYNLPVIQVAGTNGKGSVCAILERVLRSANYKTGLFTSPHLVNVNERIRINGVAIKDNDIEKFIKMYNKDIERFNITFFECMTALSTWYFKNNNIDIAIMETGLGGRLDSVSVCNPLLTIITPISYDHTEILGNTLKKIAIEKAGIMKKNIICTSAKQASEVEKTLILEANKKKSSLFFLNKSTKYNYNMKLKGEKQIENLNLALFSLEYLKQFQIKNSTKINALKKIIWHGRNQLIKSNPIIVFDVAHNKDGILSFLQFYKTLNVTGNSTLIIALYARKKITDIIPLLEINFKKIICTETNGKQPMKSENLASQFSNHHNIKIIKNPNHAIAKEYSKLNKNDGMAIIGTHCLGPAIAKNFNISFDCL